MSSTNRESLVPSSHEESLNILQNCLNTTTGIINLSTILISSGLVVIPVRSFVICVTIQRLLQGSGAAVSHSEHFAFHMSICELLSLAGFTLAVSGAMANLPRTGIAGLYFLFALFCVHIQLDTLTCVERYLAVCHPIVFRNLKNAKGARIRNVAIGYTWSWFLLVVVLMSTTDANAMDYFFITFTVLSMLIVLFCSLSVLFALSRPGPGKASPFRLQVDQSKLRAFYIILLILALLLTRIGGSAILSAFSNGLNNEIQCHIMLSSQLLKLPHTLLILLLLLSQKTPK